MSIPDTIEFSDTVEVSVKYLSELRKAAGLGINAETAEVMWSYAEMADPYGDCPSVPAECSSVGREYFARAPGTEVWIDFGDLPQATVDVLWEKYRRKMTFPYGPLPALTPYRQQNSTVEEN